MLPKNILLVTFGSYGDLHPYLAMGRALSRAGARVTIATHPQYRAQVEAQSLAFVGLPPGPSELPMDEAWAIKSNAPVRGMEFVVKEMLLPYFDEAERLFTAAARGQDLIITHFMAFFAPAVAESLKIPWLSCAYSPTVLFSAYDPPALGVMPFLPRLRVFGPTVVRAVFKFLELPSRNWFGAVHAQRARLGLPPLRTHPLFQYFSPHGTLALFPSSFGAPQPDWPPRTRQIDFPLFTEDPARDLTAPAREFLAAGDRPIVFTLGTAVSLMKTNFFDVARAAVRRLGRRAIFVVGPKPPPGLDLTADSNVLITNYESFPRLFAAADVVVHPAGTNTTALALASGRPQVCVPFANDQLDNARRVVERGAGRCVPARRLNVRRLARAIAGAPRGPVREPSDFPTEFVRVIASMIQ